MCKTATKNAGNVQIVTENHETATETITESLSGIQKSQENVTTNVTTNVTAAVTTETLEQNEELQNRVNASFEETSAIAATEEANLPETYSDSEKALAKYMRTGSEAKRLRRETGCSFINRDSVKVAEKAKERSDMRKNSGGLIDNSRIEQFGRKEYDMAVPFLKGFHYQKDESTGAENGRPASREDVRNRNSDRAFLENYISNDEIRRSEALNAMKESFLEHEIPENLPSDKYVCENVADLADRIEQAKAFQNLIYDYEHNRKNTFFFEKISAEEMRFLKARTESEISMMDFIRPVLTKNGMSIDWDENETRVIITAGAVVGDLKKRDFKERADAAWARVQSVYEQEKKARYDFENTVHNDSIRRITAEEYKEVSERAFCAQSPEEFDTKYRALSGAIYSSLTQTEKDSLFEYTGEGFKTINKTLRGVIESSGAGMDEMIRGITKAVEQSELTEDTMLFRECSTSSMEKLFGLPLNTIKEDNISLLEGKAGRDDAFMSCGSYVNAGLHAKCRLKILAPQGTKGMYLEPMSEHGRGSKKDWDGQQAQTSFSFEQETLLQRGTSLQVMSARYNTFRRQFEIEALVTGQTYVKN